MKLRALVVSVIFLFASACVLTLSQSELAHARGSSRRGCNPCDPYTVPDGIWNVSGNIAVTGNYLVPANAGVELSGDGSYRFRIRTDGTLEVQSGRGDAADVVGVRLSTHYDLATAGAKIVSIGDNAGSGYAEKVAVQFDGDLQWENDTDETYGARAASGHAWNTGAGNTYIWSVNAAETFRATSSGVTLAASKRLTLGGGITKRVSVIAASTTLDENHNVIICETGAGIVTLTLPAAASSTGVQYTVKREGANNCVLDPNGAETIDNLGTHTLGTDGSAIVVVCDGDEWHLVANR
ncbi:MAG TPA: hypothetical protein VEA38_11645 [Terriglobales bacterium]|nr:hypothetical protein [Terriglobales bacterium]